MKKAIQTFKETKEHYEKIVQAIVVEITELQVKLAQAQGQYEQAVIGAIEGTVKKEAVAKVRKEIADLKEQEANAQERKRIAVRIRNKKLQEIFPQVAQEYIAYQQEVYDKQLEEAQKLKALRCEVLLKAKDIYDMGRESRNLYQDISNIATELGTEFKVRYNTPRLPLEFVGGNRAEHLLAMPTEAREALLSGVVPAFVEYYHRTGELVRDDNKAKTLLDKLKKGGK